MRKTPSGCNTVNVVADKGCGLGSVIASGPSTGCSTAGGTGCVTITVGDKKFVVVIRIVWLSMSSRESVGVKVTTGKVATSGITVAVGVDRMTWSVCVAFTLRVGAGRTVGPALLDICIATVGIVTEAVGDSSSFDVVLQLEMIKIVRNRMKIVK